MELKSKVVVWALLLALVGFACNKGEDLRLWNVELEVVPVLPEGTKWQVGDSLWVRVENVRSAHRDSVRCAFGDSARLQVRGGNYSVFAYGSVESGPVVRRYAGGRLEVPLTEETNTVSLPLEVSETPNPNWREDEQRGSIEVRLRWPASESGRQLAGIDVEVRRRGDNQVFKGQTDAGGVWRQQLPEGWYAMEARVEFEDAATGVRRVFVCDREEVEVKKERVVVARELREVKSSGGALCRLLVQLEFPPEVGERKRSGHKVELCNLFSHETRVVQTDGRGTADFGQVSQGEYSVSLHSRVSEKSGVWSHELLGVAPSVLLDGVRKEVSLPCQFGERYSNLVIKEFYYAACISKKTGKAYQRDQYFEIYNNSPDTVYVDGVGFATTKTQTNLEREHFGQFLKEFIGGPTIPIDMLFQIPGSGREHPLAPGKSILIAELPINHKRDAPYSLVDLTGADFEMYDVSKVVTHSDEDVPEVENLKKLYCYTWSFTVFSGYGQNPLFLVYTGDKDMLEVMTENELTYVVPSGATRKAYSIPNEYVLDAVQTGNEKGLIKCMVFPPSIDAGFTWCPVKLGVCIRRKVAGKDGDRYILQDTNNSTNDFLVGVPPSIGVVVP